MSLHRPRPLPTLLASFALLAMASLGAPAATRGVGAQEQPVAAGPPLASFASMRVAILPVQLWRADTTAWSKAVAWPAMRLAIDSAVTAALQERGLGQRWAYASDVVRSAKRNPIYASDPYAIGVTRWRAEIPKAGDPLPPTAADNLRPLTALGNTRYALIPVELRADGDAVILRLVIADTRARRVVWVADLPAAGGAEMLASVSRRMADLVLEP